MTLRSSEVHKEEESEAGSDCSSVSVNKNDQQREISGIGKDEDRHDTAPLHVAADHLRAFRSKSGVLDEISKTNLSI